MGACLGLKRPGLPDGLLFLLLFRLLFRLSQRRVDRKGLRGDDILAGTTPLENEGGTDQEKF
jgi:hypothetical protein